MNRILLKTAAFTTALLLAQAALPGYGVSALGSGAANGTGTEFSESAAYYNGGSEYRYYYTEPGKSKIEFLKDGGFELSWDTDSRVMAGVIVNAINKLRLLLADMHGDDVVIGCARQYK